jgi:hypothetical protein
MEHFVGWPKAYIHKALEIITQWNLERLDKRTVKMSMPEVWTFMERTIQAGQKVLVEPYILKFQKFNSNSGWFDNSLPWCRAMQALSHYSYHVSNGQTLLCDLQGGIYQDGVILTDPVISSEDSCYGPTDLGPRGISAFFYYHICNEYCSSAWRIPILLQPYYVNTKGTTMESVPIRHSRLPLSMATLSLAEK